MRPGESKPLLLGHLGGVCLALFLYGEIVFLRQPPYNGSQSNLLLDLLGQSGVQNPGIDVATWWAKPLEFFQNLGILLFGDSPISNLPPTLSFRILISCCVQGNNLLYGPISYRRTAKVSYESFLSIMNVEMRCYTMNRTGYSNNGDKCCNMEPTLENVRFAFRNYANDILNSTGEAPDATGTDSWVKFELRICNANHQ